MKNILLVIILIVLMTGCSNDQESQAINVSENYMEAVKTGGEVDKYLETNEGFIDVFDYDYLKTIETDKEKDLQTFDYNLYTDVYADEYPTFEEYKEFELDILEKLDKPYEIIKDNGEELVVWDGESYKEIYKLLYNVEIANELGQKIYKKAEITIEPGMVEIDGDFEKRYVITNIYLR
ncbi:hypothetical protein [Terrihalobacillus insolitus]|uniref:hypothetical protein n=1 Tax=Terrihalobacillus insolitus TaxID=2950438 RepID=UPI0023417149|nr:hypothetical protein [Terrihalobacillus insolitus]MDC3412498.1 hypothetical protein [Terrihalobacillus insolitus]